LRLSGLPRVAAAIFVTASPVSSRVAAKAGPRTGAARLTSRRSEQIRARKQKSALARRVAVLGGATVMPPCVIGGGT